jgi:hypothetical protein
MRHISFMMFKMYLFMLTCNKTENKHKLNDIYFNVTLKRNVTGPRIQRTSVMMDVCMMPLWVCHNRD